MYTHRTDGSGEPWTVGHYDPQGNWHPASDWATQEEAANEVARLNGKPAIVRSSHMSREDEILHSEYGIPDKY